MAQVSVKVPQPGNRNAKRKRDKDSKFGMQIMIPAAFVFIIGILFPLLIGIFISFSDSSGITGYFGKKVTLLNYYELLFYGGIEANHFWQYTYQTLFFAIVAVTLEFGLGLIFALLLNKKFKGRGLARATLLIPWALPTVASATLFRYEFFAPLADQGVFNAIITGLGGREIVFFGADAQTLFTLPCLIPFGSGIMHIDITSTMISCILVDVWKTTPFFSLLIIAALQIVPDDLYKAGDIAGANKWQQFTKITWPMIKPGVGIALVFRMMDAIRVYDAIVVFRDSSVYSMTYQAVNFWSQSQEFGMASTVAVLEFILIGIFALLISKLTSRKSSEKPRKFKPFIKLKEGIKQVFKKIKASNKNRSFKQGKTPDVNLVSDSLRQVTLKDIRKYKRRRFQKKYIFILLILMMCFFCAGPFIWIVSRSFRDPYISQGSFELFPKFFSLNAFKVVFENSAFTGVSFGRALLNGFILSGLTGLLVLMIGSLTGYALAKFKFPGKKFSTLIIFAMTSLPPLIIIIPYFIQVKSIAKLIPFLDLTDNLFGLLIPYVAFNLPLATFVLKSFFEEMPEDLWKAAKVDGATNFQIFFKVIAPLVIPGLFTCFILVFICAWNELLFAQIWLVSDANHTVPRAILRFVQSPMSLSANWDTDIALMAATSIATVPLVIIVLIFQRQIIKGITSGAVKG